MAGVNWARLQSVLGRYGQSIWSLGLNFAVFGALVFLVTLIVSYSLSQWRRRKLPPGPPGLPILGNALQLATIQFPWLKFTEWKEKYGE